MKLTGLKCTRPVYRLVEYLKYLKIRKFALLKQIRRQTMQLF